MARANEGCGRWVTDLLEIRSDDNVLEIGFGPGVIIKHLPKRVSVGHIAGVDLSGEMVKQARARNATAIKTGRVDLRQGSAERLPSVPALLIKLWQLTRCKSGRSPSAHCEKFGGS